MDRIVKWPNRSKLFLSYSLRILSNVVAIAILQLIMVVKKTGPGN